MFSPNKAAAPLSPFFSIEGSETSSLKASHLDAYKSPVSASPFFFTKGDEIPSKKCHVLMSAVMFSMNGL